MRLSLLFTGLFAIGLLFPPLTQAQKMVTKTLDTDQVYIIPGLGAIVSQENDTLTVLMVPPANDRPIKYKSVDIEQGDIILMCNGKRTKTVKALRSAFIPVEIGSVLKLGIKRDGKMLISSLIKAKEDEAGGHMKVMTMTSGTVEDDDEGTIITRSSDGGKMITRSMHASSGEMAGVMELGALIGMVDGQVGIIGLIDNIKPKVENYSRAEGDIIKSINGTVISTVSEFQKVYDKLVEGEDLAFVIERDGESIEVSLKKGRKMKTMTRQKGSN